MKCVILAGGKGERLWPLSRKNYPKQFIRIQSNHSLFQETVARNMPYCDEFIIVTGDEHSNLVENQLKAFQGLSYRCVYEQIPRRTTASILLSVLGLQPSEFVFVVASDHLVTSDDKYKDAIIQAKEIAYSGKIALLGIEEQTPNRHYGYFVAEANGDITKFIEKPKDFGELGDSYNRNLGMMVFQVGTFINEMRKCQPEILKAAKKAYTQRKKLPGYEFYLDSTLETIESISIERSLLEKSKNLKLVNSGFTWDEITVLEDISKTSYKTDGTLIMNECEDVIAINNSNRQAVVLNKLSNVIVANTDDAIYVGKRGESDSLKNIIQEHEELKPYTEKSNIYYRQWGYYIQLSEGIKHHIRMVHVMPGKTIYEHLHKNRTENWTILQGTGVVDINGKRTECEPGQNFDIWVGDKHQITNIGTEELIFVDTSYGVALHEEERLPRNPDMADINETTLGVKAEKLIKLKPVFKDSIWGGNSLREKYGMKCDYDHIAEAWVLAAHSAGQSIVASGRHKGIDFERYIGNVGRSILGWKSASLQAFPLLVKFIDANDNLSVQVHPDDDYALRVENQYGKNEMWYVIDSKPGAGLYVGFNRDVTPDEVRERVNNNTILDVLNFYPTKPGDVFFIPAGTVHAIGAGNLVCEVQQSSNVTYRLYDFDRMDKFGNKRELHLDKAIDVINYSKYEPESGSSCEEEVNDKSICRCKYFETYLHDIEYSQELPLDDSTFKGLVVISGEGNCSIGSETMSLKAGDSVFIPAITGKLNLSGQMRVLICNI